jgi:prepilin-type processing-associated H-X9-DG protein
VTTVTIYAGNDPEFFQAPERDPASGRGFRPFDLVLTLGGVLMGVALLLPFSRSGAREAARRAHCVNNLKQIGLALHNYVQDCGALPPAYTVDPQGRPLHSWRTLILPYLEEKALYDTIDLAKPWNDPANAKSLQTPPRVFHCPSSSGPPNTTTYLASVGPSACFDPKRPRPLAEITDGTANTIMVIEAGEQDAVPWMAPVDANETLVLRFGPKTKVHHPGGTNVALADGSVKFVKTTIARPVLRALLTRAGGDVVSYDQF